MALPDREQLVRRVIETATESGWQVQRLSDPGVQPARLKVGHGDTGLQAKVNIWNLTHGGGAARPAGEYRIQVTHPYSFTEEPGWVILILGWWDPVGVFAAFDPRRHQGDLGFSPSIQIREEALRTAYERGIATHLKGNQEIAVAFRPDLLMHYVLNQGSLHQFGQSEHDLGVLNAVTADPGTVGDDVVDSVSAPRRKTVTETRRLLRDRSFRERVLAAYQSKCAVCAVQLRLVEAAHIVPVYFEGSSDATNNGLALCPNHHQAYDKALITINPEYQVLFSRARAAALAQANLHSGIEAFVGALRPVIVLPAEDQLRPRRDLLELGGSIRGWGG
jgi:putative restriction endonuclease